MLLKITIWAILLPLLMILLPFFLLHRLLAGAADLFTGLLELERPPKPTYEEAAREAREAYARLYRSAEGELV